MTGLRIGSLFTGFGGLDHAVLAVLGGTVAWVCDNNPGAARILTHRYPDVLNLGDITTVDWATVEPVDVLTGGYPCQPFSAAGKRNGVNDERHLWPYFAEAIGRLRPSLVVLENVRGHLTLGFDEVIRDLNWLGYDCQWLVNRAADVGAPHGRARVFALGVRRDSCVCSRPNRWRGIPRDQGDEQVLCRSGEGGHDGQGCGLFRPNAAHLWRQRDTLPAEGGSEPARGRMATEWPGRRSVSSADPSVPADQGPDRGLVARAAGLDRRCAPSAEWSGDLVGGVAPPWGSAAATGARPESRRPRTNGASSPVGAASGCLPVGSLVGAGRQSVRAGGVCGSDAHQWADDCRPYLRAADIGAPHERFRVFVVAARDADEPRLEGRLAGRGCAGQRTTRAAGMEPSGGESVNWGPYRPAITRWGHILGRPAPAPTEPGRNGQPRLSPAFTEWMLGLPAGWVTDVPGLTRNQRLHALGNGCVPQQAAAALRILLATPAARQEAS